ncbi:hypothetical protein [Paracoccus endophyticus]|uniref:hypothetical protein n=1 Tax=Paracoccus endophyticus TaxID=2233774 RepID=UPI0013A6D215|nr:hypothetical protein [Paracoccus endophyticus]
MLRALQTRDAALMDAAITAHFDGLERNISRLLGPASGPQADEGAAGDAGAAGG